MLNCWHQGLKRSKLRKCGERGKDVDRNLKFTLLFRYCGRFSYKWVLKNVIKTPRTDMASHRIDYYTSNFPEKTPKKTCMHTGWISSTNVIWTFGKSFFFFDDICFSAINYERLICLLDYRVKYVYCHVDKVEHCRKTQVRILFGRVGKQLSNLLARQNKRPKQYVFTSPGTHHSHNQTWWRRHHAVECYLSPTPKVCSCKYRKRRFSEVLTWGVKLRNTAGDCVEPRQHKAYRVHPDPAKVLWPSGWKS